LTGVPLNEQNITGESKESLPGDQSSFNGAQGNALVEIFTRDLKQTIGVRRDISYYRIEGGICDVTRKQREKFVA
jgi:hypothetical protein